MTYHKILVSPTNTPNQIAQTQDKAAPAAKPASTMSYQLGFTSGPTG
jgi:hypothetical protein